MFLNSTLFLNLLLLEEIGEDLSNVYKSIIIE